MMIKELEGLITVIDKVQIKEELIKKNLYDVHRDLIKQRRLRIIVMSVLVAALLLTAVYGTLENPFIYTFSNIGNFFDYRVLFIVWSIVSGLSIQMCLLALFRLEQYQARAKYTFVALSSIFLVLTAVIPALKDIYPFWHLLHTIFAGIHALFLLLSMVPFVNWISRENPRLEKVLKLWMIIIWIGSLLPLIIFGKSGLFELWFFVTVILFLLYLSLILFEEKIVKLSVAFLKDESNLNEAIEKIFINLDRK